MLYVETFSVYPLLILNQIQTSVGLLPAELARRVMKSADPEERARRAGAYTLLGRMMRKYGNPETASVAGIVKPEYNSLIRAKDPLSDIHYDSYGKPYFEGWEHVAFNLSHSQYRVACALVKREEGEIAPGCGVDIEILREDMTRATRVAERYFTEAEKALLAPYIEDSSIYCRHFTRIWTRKEAIVKYLGVGLSQIKEADSTEPEVHNCYFIEKEETNTYVDLTDGKEKSETYFITACTHVDEPFLETPSGQNASPFVKGNPRYMQL